MPTSGRSLPQPPAHISSLIRSSFRSYLSDAQSIASGKCWNSLLSAVAGRRLPMRLTEPLGASGSVVRNGKYLKEMVGTRRLELLTSTVSR